MAILMLQKMMTKDEAAFWHWLNLEIGEELKLGVPPPDIQLKDMGQWVWWGLEPEPAAEGLPLSPLR